MGSSSKLTRKGTVDVGLDLAIQSRWLKFMANRRIMRMQTSLSAGTSVNAPAGGEMSGLIAHFLFAAFFEWLHPAP